MRGKKGKEARETHNIKELSYFTKNGMVEAVWAVLSTYITNQLNMRSSVFLSGLLLAPSAILCASIEGVAGAMQLWTSPNEADRADCEKWPTWYAQYPTDSSLVTKPWSYEDNLSLARAHVE